MPLLKPVDRWAEARVVPDIWIDNIDCLSGQFIFLRVPGHNANEMCMTAKAIDKLPYRSQGEDSLPNESLLGELVSGEATKALLRSYPHLSQNWPKRLSAKPANGEHPRRV